MLSQVVAASVLATFVTADTAVPASSPKITASATTTIDWNYQSNGSDWYALYPLCKEGKKQSPIDLLKSAPLNDAIKIVGYNYFDFRLDSTYAGDPDKTMKFPEKMKS